MTASELRTDTVLKETGMRRGVLFRLCVCVCAYLVARCVCVVFVASLSNEQVVLSQAKVEA